MTKLKQLFFLCVILFTIPAFAQAAAALYLYPPSGTYLVDNTFSATVRIDSGGEAINAAEGALLFNPAELQIVSVSKNAIFSLWTTEPTFSNTAGSLVFGGGSPAGFTGNSGIILTINFKAKIASAAQVSFSSGSILAADGLGTNILSTMSGGVFNLQAKTTTPLATEEELLPPSIGGAVPEAPIISSPTHPEERKWYNNNDPDFSWQLPSDATGVSVLLHKKPTGDPGQTSDGLITSKKFENVTDGIWYFHIKFRNQAGWGPITHRAVLIDTQAPEFFEMTVDNQGKPQNPSPVLKFNANDLLSGIDSYEIKIGAQESFFVAASSLEANSYAINPQPPGEFIINVKALDAAGNYALASANIKIEPLEKPTITECPTRLKTGESLNVKGTSPYFNGQVAVSVKRAGGDTATNRTETDKEGNWSYLHPETLKDGNYEVWAVAVDERGAQSYPTDKIKLTVALPAVLQFGKIAIDYLTIINTLVVLLVGAVALIFYAWYRVSIWRKKARKETKDATKKTTKAFQLLREEIKKQIENFDSKPGLSKEEKKIHDELQKALKISEEALRKEIKDIEKEIK